MGSTPEKIEHIFAEEIIWILRKNGNITVPLAALI